MAFRSRSKESLLAFVILLAAASSVQADQKASARYDKATVTVGVAAEFLMLPETNFMVVRDNAFTTILSRNTDHNGSFTAPRGTLRIDEIQGKIGTFDVTYGYSGFFSHSAVDTNKNLLDGVNGQTRVGFSSIVPSTNGNVGLALGHDFEVEAHRSVYHFGVGLDAKFQHQVLGFFNPILGIGIGGINQNLTLRADEPQANNVFAFYRESLDTFFAGPIIGLSLAPKTIGSGFLLSGKFSVALMAAYTRYGGQLQASGILENFQNLRLLSVDFSAVPKLALSLSRKFGRAFVSLNSTAEYYSFVPQMRYNDGFVQRETRIGSDHAYGFSTGLRVKIPLN